MKATRIDHSPKSVMPSPPAALNSAHPMTPPRMPMTMVAMHPRFSDPVAMRASPPASSPTTIQPMMPIGDERYRLGDLGGVVAALVEHRPAASILEGGPCARHA